jgi:hypothetical protein
MEVRPLRVTTVQFTIRGTLLESQAARQAGLRQQ